MTDIPEEKVKKDFLSNFDQLLQNMKSIMIAKNNDYANEDPFFNFREYGTMGFMVRMSDKWRRLRNIIDNKKIPTVLESVEDTLLDLANYCLLLICWLRYLRSEEGKS